MGLASAQESLPTVEKNAELHELIDTYLHDAVLPRLDALRDKLAADYDKLRKLRSVAPESRTIAAVAPQRFQPFFADLQNQAETLMNTDASNSPWLSVGRQFLTDVAQQYHLIPVMPPFLEVRPIVKPTLQTRANLVLAATADPDADEMIAYTDSLWWIEPSDTEPLKQHITRAFNLDIVLEELIPTPKDAETFVIWTASTLLHEMLHVRLEIAMCDMTFRKFNYNNSVGSTTDLPEQIRQSFNTHARSNHLVAALSEIFAYSHSFVYLNYLGVAVGDRHQTVSWLGDERLLQASIVYFLTNYGTDKKRLQEGMQIIDSLLEISLAPIDFKVPDDLHATLPVVQVDEKKIDRAAKILFNVGLDNPTPQ